MADPWWLPGCLDNLKKIPGATLCSENHCTEAQNQVHAVCNCQAPYQNGCSGSNPPINCCSYTAESPMYVIPPAACYCCCGCFANGTPIAVDNEHSKAIEEFCVGDLVYVADDISLTKWSQKPVQFSSGTGDLGAYNTMIKVTFEVNGNKDFLLVNRNQIFLMADKKLKRASKLVPGQDQLLAYDGTPAPVLDLSVGKFKKGVHHIATSREPATTVDGHLILARGIVCGDYALQSIDLDYATRTFSSFAMMTIDNHNDLPEFGTKEYIEAYPHLTVNEFKAHLPENEIEHPDKAIFEPFGFKKTIHIPDHAHYFLSEAQALDIAKNAPASPISSGAGHDITVYLFKLFKGFYPDVNFYLDETSELSLIPNAYSFFQFEDKKYPFVMITSALIRTEAIKFESLALVIAHELGHLYGGSPLNEHEYTCEGMSDYAAVTAILPYIWFGIYSRSYVDSALEQIKELFSYISPENAKGKPGSKCMNIAIECRLKAMENAASTKPLPECAGGPPDPFLEVIGAEVFEDSLGVEGFENSTGTYVTLTFNSDVELSSAEELGNYSFKPLVSAYSAKVKLSEPSKVTIKADIQKSVEYEIFVYNVLSVKNQPLVFDKNHASFKLKASDQ